MFRRYFVTALRATVVVAQAGELLHVMEHVSVVSVSATLLLLTMLVATKSGTEEFPDGKSR